MIKKLSYLFFSTLIVLFLSIGCTQVSNGNDDEKPTTSQVTFELDGASDTDVLTGGVYYLDATVNEVVRTIRFSKLPATRTFDNGTLNAALSYKVDGVVKASGTNSITLKGESVVLKIKLTKSSAEDDTVASPVFDPIPATYSKSTFEGVTLSCSNEEAKIYYTTDGSEPTDKSDLFNDEPIELTETTTIKAIAYVGTKYSEVISGEYVLSDKAVTDPVQFSPVEDASKSYDLCSFAGVTLSCKTSGADIYYLVDSTKTPSKSSTKYVAGTKIKFTTAGTHTIKAIAYKDDFEDSSVTSGKYVMTQSGTDISEPVFDPLPGTYSKSTFEGVSLTCSDEGAKIYYTTDGSTPDEGSTLYDGTSIKFAATTTVKAVAYVGDDFSETVEGVYTLSDKVVVEPVQFSLSAGKYELDSFAGVTLTSTTSGASIYYLVDSSSEPNDSSTAYTAGEKITFTTVGLHTIKAIAYKKDCVTSSVTTVEYELTKAEIKVTAPTITPASGTYTTSTFSGVTITTNHTGAKTYYTKDGTAPTNASTEYSAAIPLTADGSYTIKAVSYYDGIASDVVSAAYKLETPYDGVIIYVKASPKTTIWAWEVGGKDISGKDGFKGTWPGQTMEAATGMNDNTGWFMFKIPAAYLTGGLEIQFKLNGKPDGTGSAGFSRSGGKTGWLEDTDLLPGSETWYDTDPTKPVGPAVPVITMSPAGGTFTGSTVSVTITVTDATTAKYTTDGTDPKNGTSFSGSKTLSIGSDMSVGDTKTISVYAQNGEGDATKSETFTKIDKPATPTRLGAYYTSSSTTFTIWSPSSSSVTVTVNGTTYTCTAGFKVDGGYSDTANIYGVTVPGDLKLKEYQFKIGGAAVRDPYGVMVKYESGTKKTYTENTASITADTGSNTNIVMDVSSIKPEGGSWATRPALANREDSIIYEVHVGDFTSDTDSGVTISKRGKFLGMVETGTKYSSLATGIDHLKELGVTHVQLMPIYDYATKHNGSTNDKYNWGYDPVNFNVPEDRFATDPSAYEERIKELKTMVNEFHKNGIRVVMDVVYNHTFWDEMFTDITGKYYTGNNDSGCGNGVDTGNSMVSRFIRDSLEYWAEEYGIDGFRFDLIGIYKYAEVNNWGVYLNQKFSDRTLLLYGEPWDGYFDPMDTKSGGTRVRMDKVKNMVSGHVGVFNGKYRESIKGSNDDGGMGYMFNNVGDTYGATAWNISVGLRGSGTGLGSDSEGVWTRYFTSDPEQSINYISAHDNYCLYDKVITAGKTGDYAARLTKFGHGIVMVSQGIPFLHAGDEFLRTKKIGSFASHSHNSYMWGQEMNKIYWKLKSTNAAIYNYNKDLVALRKANAGLRLTTSSEINSYTSQSISGNAITIQTDNNKDGTKDLVVVVNPGSNVTASLPSGSWTKIFDASGAVSTTDTTCEGTAVTVFKKN